MAAVAGRAGLAGFLALATLGSAHANGTGFIVSSDGVILTSHHVADGCASLVAEHGGRATPAQLLTTDPVNDLALLRLPHAVPWAALFRSGQPIRPGDDVIAVGFPLPGILASQANVTTGAVSADAGPGDDPRFLQISAPIQSGNSGGPLLDRFGNVVGMVFAKLDALALASVYGDIPQNINFAVKGDIALAFLDANGVRYRVGRRGAVYGAADVGAQAKRFTVFLKCQDDRPAQRVGSYMPLPLPMPRERAAAARLQPAILLPHPTASQAPAFHAPMQGAAQAAPIARDWAIQVGAFHSVALADGAVSRATSHARDWLSDSEILIVPTQTSSGTLYRARLAGLDRHAAAKACDSLKRIGMSCFVVPMGAVTRARLPSRAPNDPAIPGPTRDR